MSIGKGLNPYIKQVWDITILEKEPRENVVGKGENAGNYQHFLLYTRRFLSHSKHKSYRLDHINVLPENTLKSQ